MHDHWSLFKKLSFERTFSFSGKYTEKEKGGDHGVHQGYII